MNRTKTSMPSRSARKQERGAVLTAFVLTSTALFALTAVGVDTGRLALTANEVQTVADTAATAGARALVEGGSAATARAQAQTVVGQNRVNGTAASIQAAQLEVGSYNAATGSFANGAVPANAVRATPAPPCKTSSPASSEASSHRQR